MTSPAFKLMSFCALLSNIAHLFTYANIMSIIAFLSVLAHSPLSTGLLPPKVLVALCESEMDTLPGQGN